MAETTAPPPPETALARTIRDTGLTAIAILAIAFSHLVTGLADADLWPGLAVVFAIVVVGYGLAHAIPIRQLPDLFWVSIVAMAATWPGVPGSAWVRETIGGVDFLATITPLMAFAALGLGQKEVSLFRKAGLQFVAIALLVFFGTFLGSAMIAHLVLQLTGA